MNRWLFLDDGPAPGDENMARDEFLFERAARGAVVPVLRLYSFEPPAVTIGYHQNPEKILDGDAARADGLDCVRRITGGRALLHDGELTYCVAAPSGFVHFGTSPGETHLRISEALRAALRSIGVDAEISRGREHSPPNGMTPPCLCSVSRNELAVGGRKIAGSAQRKTAAAFLQHGSILVRPGSERIVKYVRGSWGSIGGRMTSIFEELDREPDTGALRSALVKAFSETFDVEWEPLRFSESDEAEVRLRILAKRRESIDMFAGEECCP